MMNLNRSKLLRLFDTSKENNNSNTQPKKRGEPKPTKPAASLANSSTRNREDLKRKHEDTTPTAANDLSEAVKSKKVKKKRRKKQDGGNSISSTIVNDVVASKSPAEVKKAAKGGKTGDRKKADLQERLAGARFRYLNEMLYTSDSTTAMKSFKSDPRSFQVYHEGYRRQIEKWPVKPIELAIQYVKSKPKHQIVADLGCGEALLAASVPHKVHSFDIQALNERVTVADMSNLPLQDDSVDMVIFCLSLMGTNLSQFVQEAHRILKQTGIMWIAEVASRFDGDVKTFSDAVEAVGFKCTSCNVDMTHFVTLTFKKTVGTGATNKSKKKTNSKTKGQNKVIELSPCLYKKR